MPLTSVTSLQILKLLQDKAHLILNHSFSVTGYKLQGITVLLWNQGHNRIIVTKFT